MKVFVYGTLRIHERNHGLLENANLLSRQCWTYGVLYDTGHGYPAMVTHNENRVYGELYEVNQEQLKQLDYLEGYSGKGLANHYDRITQNIYSDHGTFQAEVYVYPAATINSSKEIEFGDWKCHQNLVQDELLYFAYGSCMDDARFMMHGVAEQFNYLVGCGTLNGYKLAFTHEASDGGRADMVESDDYVEGKVYQLKKETLSYLFKREGVYTKIYRPAFIDLKINGRSYHDVLTFLVVDKDEEVAPPEHYYTEIFRGAKGIVSDAYYQKMKEDLQHKFMIQI